MHQELTVRAILLGLLLSAIMGAANVYLGLRVGMTVSASIPAAVVGILLLRVVFRGGTILEANQIQTAASAGESLAAGVIFTLPALVLVGAWEDFNWWLTTGIAVSGGLLGVLFMIPMRRVFVVDNKDLAFPEGVACAEVLRAAEAGSDHTQNALPIFIGASVGALFKIFAGFFEIIAHSLQSAFFFGNQRVFYFGADISPALLGVGFIVKWRIALLIFIGGTFAWLFCIPLLGSTGTSELSAVDSAWHIWDSRIRYIGVGAMLVAGFDSIIRVRSGLRSAFLHVKDRLYGNNHNEGDDEDISSRSIAVLATLIVIVIARIYFEFTHNLAVTLLATVLMFVLSFFFTAVASYIVGLVGSSNSPVSGMTITAVLISGLFILATTAFTGVKGIEAMAAMLGVAGIVCCVACTSGDVCNDLKTGHLVGASPKLQQRMQIAGVIVGAVVMAPVLKLLHENTPGGIGGRELAAPQATLFANLARGFFSDQRLPWDMVWSRGWVLALSFCF
ncbi:MAG: oligopeptide transporter, OPT family [Myxococcales bacterium]|nr:MAG: oligopeptide transporter, OPT family [Myxococcales bacterium]